MKKILTLLVLIAMASSFAPAFAGTKGQPGHVSGKSVGAAAVSLLLWPGLGQFMLDNPKDKNITHAVLGLTGIPSSKRNGPVPWKRAGSFPLYFVKV